MPRAKRRVWDKQKVKEIQEELATQDFTASEAIRHFAAKGYTDREIAEGIGKSPPYVYNVLKQTPKRNKSHHKIPAESPTEQGIWQRFLSFFKAGN